MRRVLLAAILVALASFPAFYGTRIAGQQPTFRSGVEVVLLDVNVVDGSNAPVGDLAPGDFIVSVDRKPRKVVSAQFMRYDVRTSITAERPGPVPEGRTSANAAVQRPPARNVLIVIDNDSMTPGDGIVVRQEASKFIDKLAPDDRVGVVTIPRLQSVVTMTKVRDDVRASLAKVITASERYRSMRFNIGLAEAFGIERQERGVADVVIGRECCGVGQIMPCRVKEPECPIDVIMEVRQLQMLTHVRGELSLEALRDLADALGRIPGPKTLLYVTGGAPPPDSKSPAAYSRIEAAFAAAQITLYALYVHQDAYGQGATRDRFSPTPLEDMAIEREGVENATGAAGGTFMDAVGSFGQYFDRVVTEMSGSYLLGIEVQASDRDGKPHRVSVKVNREAVVVRARNSYVIEPPRPSASPAATLPVGVTAAVARPPATPAPENPAARLEATPGDLRPLIEQMGQYAHAYERAFLALLCEERAELTLSRWKAGTPGAWTLENRRRLAADNLLVRRTGASGWTALRDVFEVDGLALRQRDGRLRALFLQAPESMVERAMSISLAASSHDIGFVDRSTNVATGPLVFLNADNRPRFVFAKQGEQTVAGVAAWQIAFAQHGAPAFARPTSGTVPISGAMWVDPNDGTILKTVVRWAADGTTAEVAVTYGRTPDRSMWVPAEMTETYQAGSSRLDCLTKFWNYRKFAQ